MLRSWRGVVLTAWFALTSTACGQTVRAQLERVIELKGVPHTRVPVITAVAIHPSGKLLATAGDDHLVRLWDIDSGRLVNQLRGHRDWITAVAFCTDGRELITGSRDRRVLIWTVQTGQLEGSLDTFDYPITSLRVGPEERVAVLGFRAPLKLYDLTHRKLDRVVKCPCSDTRAVAFSSDLGLLAAGGRNGMVRVWDLVRGDSFDVQALERRVRSILFVPGRNLIVVAGDDARIGVWDLTSRKPARRFPNPSGKVLSMTMIGELDFAVSGSDNTIRLFRHDADTPHAVLTGHTGSIPALTAREGTLISGSFDTTVRIWKILETTPPSVSSSLSTRVTSTASPK